MNYYERAKELREETVANRRYLHTNAEVGLNMPKAQAFVMGKLKEYGLEPKECGHGVTATLGKGGKVLMLRADMACTSDAGREWGTVCMPVRSGSTCVRTRFPCSNAFNSGKDAEGK